MHPSLVATFALIPIVVGAEIVAYYLLTIGLFSPFGWGAPTLGFYLAQLALFLLPLVIFYGGGLLIWWSAVRWTRRKRWGVFLTTMALFILLAATTLTGFIDSTFMVLAALVVSLVGGGIALIVAGWTCWEPPTGEHVPCSNGGYDLRGQHECRCQECGRQFTVGDLVSRDSNYVS